MARSRGVVELLVKAETLGLTLGPIVRRYRWDADWPPNRPLGFVCQGPDGRPLFLGRDINEAMATMERLATPPGRRPPKREKH